MKKHKVNWLYRGILESPYCYALCISEKSFHAELKRLGLSRNVWPDFLATRHANATTHFFVKDEGREFCCIVTIDDSPRRNTEETYALIVHEAVHIWQEIKDNIGEKHPGRETEAYAIQRIALELMAEYKRLTKGGKHAKKK